MTTTPNPSIERTVASALRSLAVPLSLRSWPPLNANVRRQQMNDDSYFLLPTWLFGSVRTELCIKPTRRAARTS